MPQRSTPFQAIVRHVREHLAAPGVTVTESKSLIDAHLGCGREVDVVIEGTLDGEPMVISMEIRERARPADLPWVQEMLRKHRDLPTNLLILVSKSGFTAGALMQVAAEAGKVQALTPELGCDAGRPYVKRVFIENFTYNTTGCKVLVRLNSGEQTQVTGHPLFDVCGVDGAVLGSLDVLVGELLNLQSIRQGFFHEARNHEDRSLIQGFSAELLLEPLGYHLRRSDGLGLNLIVALEVLGDFSVWQSDIVLTPASLGGRTYSAGQAVLNGRETVWVGTTDRAAQAAKLSWQATDRPRSSVAAATRQTASFPELITLFPPVPPDVANRLVDGDSL